MPLVLGRKEGESIVIDPHGQNIKITILDITGGKVRRVRLCIDAPRHIVVHRQEVVDILRKEAANGASSG